VPVDKDFVDRLLSVNYVIEAGKARQVELPSWRGEVLANMVLAEAWRLHLSKLPADRVPEGLQHPKDCLAILCHGGRAETTTTEVKLEPQGVNSLSHAVNVLQGASMCVLRMRVLAVESENIGSRGFK
jgi:hypothetical protein